MGNFCLVGWAFPIFFVVLRTQTGKEIFFKGLDLLRTI